MFPYDVKSGALTTSESIPVYIQWLWPAELSLGNRATFRREHTSQQGYRGGSGIKSTLERLSTPLTIAFADLATHNHFVLDRGGKVFKQSAPIIKLPATPPRTTISLCSAC